MMMPVTLAIRCDINHPTRPGPPSDTFRQGRTRRQCLFKCDCMRDIRIVEKDWQRFSRTVAMVTNVRNAGVDAVFRDFLPTCGTTVANARGLLRSKDHIPQPVVDKRVEHVVVTRSFRKPHRFGFTAKAITKISHAPT